MIFVTGHSRGIGQALYSALGDKGYSRSNGYDLTTEKDRNRMYADLPMCSVFINNAFMYKDPLDPKYMWTQTEILYGVYQRMNSDQLIINISSNTVDENPRKVWPYQAAKAGLDKAIYQLQYVPNGPMISSIKFGYVGTQRILDEEKPKTYVRLEQVVKSVSHIIEASRDGYLINNMLVRAHE